MLTCFPRCFAFSMAIALMLPSLHAQAATIGASNVDGVCLAKTFKTGVGGMRLPVWRPYLLLKDGSAYANPKLAPDIIDPVASRQSEADRWGSWTQQGNNKTLNIPGHNPMPSAQCVPPAAAGMPLQGSFKHVGGGGTIAGGGQASFMRSDNYRFYPDGHFIAGSSSGLVAPGASTVSNADRAGHYRVHDYSIDLRYDDGSEAQLFFYADGEKLLHIGDEDYVPTAD
ncbi:MAG TPA: hypothetical protein VFJ26_20570 [Dyella sp.]|nr:hypothetical protein [Dyella sp.]